MDDNELRKQPIILELRKIIADLCGYFWLPCPCCGEMFAGYETGKISVPDKNQGPGYFLACCRWCDDR